MLQQTIPQLQAQAQAKAIQPPILPQIAALQQQAATGMTTSTSNTSLAGLSSIVGNYNLADVPTLPALMAPSLTASAAAANAANIPIAKPAMTLAQIGNKALVRQWTSWRPRIGKKTLGPSSSCLSRNCRSRQCNICERERAWEMTLHSRRCWTQRHRQQ